MASPSIHYGEIYTRYGVSATEDASRTFVAELAPTLRFAQPGDVVIAAVGETVEDVGKAVAWLGDDDVAIHDDCFAYPAHAESEVRVATTSRRRAFHAEKAKHVARAKVKRRLRRRASPRSRFPSRLSTSRSGSSRSSTQFDALVNDLSVGLPAELDARRQQYEYYRDRLLTFERGASHERGSPSPTTLRADRASARREHGRRRVRPGAVAARRATRPRPSSRRRSSTLLQSQAYEYLPITSEAALDRQPARPARGAERDRRSPTPSGSGSSPRRSPARNDGIVEKTVRIQEDHVQVLKRDDGTTKNIYLIDKTNIHNNRLQVINQYEVGRATAHAPTATT